MHKSDTICIHSNGVGCGEGFFASRKQGFVFAAGKGNISAQLRVALGEAASL